MRFGLGEVSVVWPPLPWTGQRWCTPEERQGQPVSPAVESGYGQNFRHAGQTRRPDTLNPLEKAGCGVQ